MSLPTISPDRAAVLLRDGAALLVDVREADERAFAHVPGSRHLPLSRLGTERLDATPGRVVVFHCQSGARTAGSAAALAAQAAGCEAYLLDGGLSAWQKAGLRVERAAGATLPLMRQVQIAAGGLALAGAVLGAFVSPGFHALSGLVGAGLIMAGVTGLCPMASALARLPWNRRPA